MGEKPNLFGTDGVRGVAGVYPLDRATVWNLGRALGLVLEKRVAERPLRVVLGEDTRESSAWISCALAAGLAASGVEVVYAGVITTPGVAFLARHHAFAAGAMVSASHNPYQDNGIKVLSNDGTKLPEALELDVERELGSRTAEAPPGLDRALAPLPELLEDYVEHLRRLVPPTLELGRYKLVVDCANGAAARVVPKLFAKLGVEAQVLHCEPNGRNINTECGSIYPEVAARETKSRGAQLGVAFDGDADRAIFATSEGRVADGDHILYAMAQAMASSGRLKGGGVVGTLMTNVGLELALASRGIALKRTAVGDKYVLEEMLRSGINLGGEPSGHIIFSDLSLAGDGILTLLQLLRLLAEDGKPFETLIGGLKQFPQILRNVRVRAKPAIDSLPEVARAVEACRREFAERGRVVVRYSGTEPLARVMVEGESAEAVERHVARIAAAIDTALGAR